MHWILFALAIILALAAYALWLWRRVWQRARADEQRRHAGQDALLDQMEIMCRAVLQQQMNLTEGALRLASLLDKLRERPPHPLDLGPIHQLADSAAAFAIGAERDALPREERRRQDSARQALEAEQEEAVVASVTRLLAALPEWRLHRQLGA
ncbi:DUF2489 domain-containing protein [Alcanivorax sp. JB21]|uniref:DUF2489 domain-containing protein n=1 Tax=Alcanivorax limicola TaxID=2874102 RepID=UPI001CBE0E3D|nr:DUF2489 domain-containing protein [Alcanivorax limicola]MBZ2187954.1 DUF2489 domain-containing protein [Alcanivorax limicola]